MKEKFEITFECEFEVEEDEHAVVVAFRIMDKETGRARWAELACAVPGDAEDRAAWAEQARAALRRALAAAMTDEARLLFYDAANFHYEASGFDPKPVGRKELAKIHLNQTAERVGTFLRTKGQRSPWTTAELSRAIYRALRAARKQKRNYAGVVEALRASYPDKAPPTVAALKALVKRLGVDWKGLKDDRSQG